MRNRIARLRFPLAGRRIDLDLPGRRHVPELLRLMTDPSIARWTSHIPYPYRRSDALEWIERTTRERRKGRTLSVVIVRRRDGRMLGGSGLHHLDDEGTTGEVGYWICREFRGEGYASEAVRMMLTVGFRSLGLHRIEALVFPRNRASRRVVQRCGFRYEGCLRDEIRKDGRWRSSLLYSRLATDPPHRAKRRRKRVR